MIQKPGFPSNVFFLFLRGPLLTLSWVYPKICDSFKSPWPCGRMKSSESPKICRTPRGGPEYGRDAGRCCVRRSVNFRWIAFFLPIELHIGTILSLRCLSFVDKIRFHQLNLRIISCSVPSDDVSANGYTVVHSSLARGFRSFLRLESLFFRHHFCGYHFVRKPETHPWAVGISSKDIENSS